MTRGRVDLHLHTTCSDGALAPAEVVALLARAGATAGAITDHDTLEGFAAARETGDRLGVRIIPAAELSVAHEGQDLHVLAYFVDPEDAPFRRMLEEVRLDRVRRLEEMVAKLRLLGLPVEVPTVLARADAGNVGRVHLARELHERGWVRSYADAFHHYIGDAGPAFAPKRTPGLADSFAAIRAAGGVAVLAHPGMYALEGLFEEMLDAGLDGVEVYHPAHAPEQVAALEALAARWGLVKTGGSDYHGVREAEMPPGSLELGEEIVDELEARARRHRERA